jgi:methylenetetrahydrofolate dehydrogenase (NADP+)/methenyltetrahydrofolate cyclohydrolase
MKRIDGTGIAQKVHEESKQRIASLAKRGFRPGLAVILVGDDPASLAYVRSKDKKAAELGLHSVKHELPADTHQERLVTVVRELNADPLIHGILVQSPPPPHINEQAVVETIDRQRMSTAFIPSMSPSSQWMTPRIRSVHAAGLHPSYPGNRVRNIRRKSRGRGPQHAGGKADGLLLMRRGKAGDATVTVAHSRTRDLAGITRAADIVIAAIGRPHFLGANHIGNDAVVIDVGINRIEDPHSAKGYRIVGDVDFEAVAERCAAITPVPGGVGPMTIAMLMANTVTACERLAS